MNEYNEKHTSDEILLKYITNENVFIKIYGIRHSNLKFDLKRLGEIYEAQKDSNSFELRKEILYVAKIEDQYERVRISQFDDFGKVAYAFLIDVGNSSTAIPFHEVSSLFIHACFY